MTTWQEFDQTTGDGVSGSAVTTWTYYAKRGFLKEKLYPGQTAGQGVNYAYTGAGRLKERIWSRGARTDYVYNNAGDLWKALYTDSDAGVTTPDVIYQYDRMGRLDVVQDGVSVRKLQHGVDGQIEREDFQTGSQAWLAGYAIEHGYDNLRRLDRIDLIDPVPALLHRQAYTYDSLTGRLGTAKRLGDNAFTYGYNKRHNRVSSVSVTGTAGTDHYLSSGWSYDRLGRVTSAYSFSETPSGYPFAESRSYSYNAANQREEVSIWRNSDFFADSSHWGYGYDFLGQVTSAKRYRDDLADTAVSGLDFEYAFDDIGNRTQTTTNGRTASYTLDANGRNQYAQRDVPSAVDLIGISDAPEVRANGITVTNRLNSYFYQELNAANSAFDNSVSDKYRAVTVEEWDGTTKLGEESGHMHLAKHPEAFTYDGDGNLLTDGRWKYTWDAENRLIEVEEARTDDTHPLFGKANYDYDYMGRRVRRIQYERYGADPWVQVDETRYFYSGWNVMAELNSSGGKTRTYLWGLDAAGTFGGAGGVGGARGGHRLHII